MYRRALIVLGATALLLGGLLLVSTAASAALRVVPVRTATSSFTVSPWAYACGQTHYGNPVTANATCTEGKPQGLAFALYAGGELSMNKTGQLSEDLASGATIGGLVTLSAASFDLMPGSYCGAGAPRLNVVTADGKTHFFGCLANNHDGHVTIDLSAAGDGSGNGGVGPDDTLTAIDFVQDEPGTASLKNLSFTGTAPAASPSPSASASASPAPQPAPVLAQTGSGEGFVFLFLLGFGLMALIAGVGRLITRRR